MQIEENIAFGLEKDMIDSERVYKVAKLAFADAFIEEFPNSYQTRVGEGGVGLSGGQQQRIGIARALYREPQLLILDEAFASLDKQSAETVGRSIFSQLDDCTVLFITHTLKGVSNIDNVFEPTDGKLV